MKGQIIRDDDEFIDDYLLQDEEYVCKEPYNENLPHNDSNDFEEMKTEGTQQVNEILTEEKQADEKTEFDYEIHYNSECDFACSDCVQRSHLQQKRNFEASKNEPRKQKLLLILSSMQVGQTISFKNCQMFSINGYIEDGIVVDPNKFTVHFSKKKNRFGLGFSSNNKHCWVDFTNDCFGNCEIFGQVELDQYKTHIKQVEDELSLDTSRIDSVRFLLQDIVFEDWVHKVKGFLIPITELNL